MRFAALLLCMIHASAQVVITDTGSTNRPGLSISIGTRGHAVIESRRGAKVRLRIESELQHRFMEHVEAAAPLNELKVNHCMKSVSFGSSTFITYQGSRSPDLSCPNQQDPHAAALQKDLDEIMEKAHRLMPSHR